MCTPVVVENPVRVRNTLVAGSSTAPDMVSQGCAMVKPDEVVMVILDSNHSYEHVFNELNAYSGLVTKGSYIVATDGIMFDLGDVPRGHPDWSTDNPMCAAAEFARHNPAFTVEQPGWLFNESDLTDNITHWPGAWLRRV